MGALTCGRAAVLAAPILVKGASLEIFVFYLVVVRDSLLFLVTPAVAAASWLDIVIEVLGLVSTFLFLRLSLLLCREPSLCGSPLSVLHGLHSPSLAACLLHRDRT